MFFVLTTETLCLPCSVCPAASHPTLLVSPLHGERALLAPPSTPHCLAYLPALSQPSVVMLYGPDQLAEGQRSPGVECRKRKRLEEEEARVKKRHISGLEEHDKVRNDQE